MDFKSESHLQNLIIDTLKKDKILETIAGIDELDDHLNREINDKFIPGFQIDFQLRTLYCKKAKEVLDSFTFYEIISGEEIKNISIQKDTKAKKERLYPDALIANSERSNFSILELKKDYQTEREAITELFAYAIEVKNHLPNIADSDINLVIISTKFNTLLDHSISSLILGTKFNILALKADFVDKKLALKIHIPDSWTDIWQNTLPEYAFSSVSLVPYQYDKKKETPPEIFLFEIIDDLISFNGAKNNSHGFFVIWKNITHFESPASFCISLYQINPFVFLKASLENNFTLNTNEPLCKYILDNYSDNEYYHPESLMNVAKEVKKFLDQYFDTSYEDFSSWTDHIYRGSNFRSQALPMTFNSWGNIGDYVRYYFFHPSLKNGFYSDKQLNSPLFYKDPVFGIELINRISGNTLFENGVYNFTSLFEYAKQLRELLNISNWYIETKKGNQKKELLEPRLYFATLDVLASSREIQYRLNYIDVELEKPTPLRIDLYEAYEDTVDNITENIRWFTSHFLKNNPIHQEFFSNSINWCSIYMDSEMIIDSVVESKIKKEIVGYCKTIMFAILEGEIISKSSFFGDKIFDIISVYFNSVEKLKNVESRKELFNLIESIEEEKILNYFDNAFLLLLDNVYFEVFHPLVSFNDVSFITKDWKKLKLQLIKRYNEGHRYGAIILDSNGNLAIGILPKEYQYTKPIDDPEKEVYIMINESGIGVISLVNWDQVKDGSAFSIKQKKV
ncbi:hypothetical protein B0I03_10719 [Flavobacterium aquaticum]|uniref:Uncharacterized protein n=1 Tax=Flavobacterium aquaticum TaxID=1236486 RepID=A0A327YHV8_9FLAO|nr:hypothetical protein [Flavobacterium aquaticum]RAK20600.1 hypothetical protein B0I03_10719 [Flavobacterium aquaticum]